MRSIRSCSRARTTERGFALVWAIGLAILYFALIELMLIDSARELAEARRFRSKVIANTLAENGAELAAAMIVERGANDVPSTEDWQGTLTGTMHKDFAGAFMIEATGETKGTDPAKSTVTVQGKVTGEHVRIDFTVHKQ